MEEDFSKEIYDKYFNKKDRILEITLKDGNVLEGMLVGFFHGDRHAREPFIVRWHFVSKEDIEKHNVLSTLDFEHDYAKLLNQKDIESISFKD